MLKDKIIVVAFNAKLADGCDYATQTLDILGRKNAVYGLVLGEPVVWKSLLRSSGRSLVSRAYHSVLVRPFFLIPGQRFSPIKQLNYFLNALGLRIFLAIRYPLKKKVFWFFEPWNILPVFHALRGYVSVYDCVDYFVPLRYEPVSYERYLIHAADLMTSTSQSLADAHRSTRRDIPVVPLGFADDIFSGIKRTVRTGQRSRFTVGYIGGINYRLDYALLTRVIREISDARFVFVGPIQTGLIGDDAWVPSVIRSLKELPNVEFSGDIRKQEVGRLLASIDVGIIPYNERYDFNRHAYPMKIMEYFWYGLPVVATDIIPLRAYEDLIRTESSAEGWTRALRAVRVSGKQKQVIVKQKAVAAGNTWKKKLDAISGLLSPLMDTGAHGTQ